MLTDSVVLEVESCIQLAILVVQGIPSLACNKSSGRWNVKNRFRVIKERKHCFNNGMNMTYDKKEVKSVSYFNLW